MSGEALKLTGKPNYFPAVLLIGSSVVPVAFVTYIYERERRIDIHTDSPIVSAVSCFLVGGATGIIVAGVIEFKTLHNLDIPGLVAVGLIEEAAKLILPVTIYLQAATGQKLTEYCSGLPQVWALPP